MIDAYSVPNGIARVNFSARLIKSSIRTQKYWEFISLWMIKLVFN